MQSIDIMEKYVNLFLAKEFIENSLGLKPTAERTDRFAHFIKLFEDQEKFNRETHG